LTQLSYGKQRYKTNPPIRGDARALGPFRSPLKRRSLISISSCQLDMPNSQQAMGSNYMPSAGNVPQKFRFGSVGDWALPDSHLHRETTMNRNLALVGILAAGCLIATAMLTPGVGYAQADPRVAKSMETLKTMTAKLGTPKLQGNEAVGGKEAPALYFGTTKINNNFDIVDAVEKEDGKGMTATLFAKGGDEYVRVSTNVPKPDGSGRAVGTVLAGPALESIKAGKAYYGEVPILGTPYLTGYEPIKDSSGAQIGVYYVGYKK
jgi:hypothetical protein